MKSCVPASCKTDCRCVFLSVPPCACQRTVISTACHPPLLLLRPPPPQLPLPHLQPSGTIRVSRLVERPRSITSVSTLTWRLSTATSSKLQTLGQKGAGGGWWEARPPSCVLMVDLISVSAWCSHPRPARGTQRHGKRSCGSCKGGSRSFAASSGPPWPGEPSSSGPWSDNGSVSPKQAQHLIPPPTPWPKMSTGGGDVRYVSGHSQRQWI